MCEFRLTCLAGCNGLMTKFVHMPLKNMCRSIELSMLVVDDTERDELNLNSAITYEHTKHSKYSNSLLHCNVVIYDLSSFL